MELQLPQGQRVVAGQREEGHGRTCQGGGDLFGARCGDGHAQIGQIDLQEGPRQHEERKAEDGEAEDVGGDPTDLAPHRLLVLDVGWNDGVENLCRQSFAALADVGFVAVRRIGRGLLGRSLLVQGLLGRGLLGTARLGIVGCRAIQVRSLLRPHLLRGVGSAR